MTDKYFNEIKFSAEELMIEGIEYLNEGNYYEALNYFQKSLEQNQNLP